MKGTVKWFNRVKGYGFIRPEDDGKDVFVHYSSIVTEKPKDRVLEDGEVVEFEIAQAERGPTAVGVKKV